MPIKTLLLPFRCSFKNRFFPRGLLPVKTLAAILFSIFLCAALYLVAVKIVGYFHRQNELGIILSLKIFQMAWIILFAMQIFSCMVSAVSTMFLSEDNEIVYSAPVPDADLYGMRFITTAIYTSWMMIVFSIPIFAAYGKVFGAGWLYWLLMPLAVVSTTAIATGTGTVATIVLVNLFPARRTKDIVLYLSLCFGIFIYILFRLMRPEDLVNPDRYSHFVDYLSSISTPAAPYIPAAWAANLLSLYLLDRELDWLILGLIVISPAALYFAGEWVMQRWFFNGLSKSQESFGGYREFAAKAVYKPRAWLWIFIKESKTFIRDSAEWSQLFMIAALIIVYLYNFKMLPVDRSMFQEEYVTNLISFFNIGLAGFIITSLSARFVYPSVGAEGGAFYIIRSSPLSLVRYLLNKYLYYVIPFTLLGLLMVVASDELLNIEGPMWWISIISILLISWTVVALALGFGSLHADFKAESRAAALGSMGAILFLFTAMTYEILFLICGFYPAYGLVKTWMKGEPFTMSGQMMVAGWLFFFLTVGVFLAVFFLKKGLNKLRTVS